MRPTRADIDLGAVAHNIEALRALVAPTPLCAVVKADGYGHGAVPVARAAAEAGATCLAVALVEEAAELRAGGVTHPVMLLSEAPVAGVDEVVALEVEPAVYSTVALAALERAAARARSAPVGVHLKIDTGMHRVGAQPPEALALATAIDRSAFLTLASVWTHLAVADEPDDPFTAVQLDRFASACAAIEEEGVAIPTRHAANSAGAIAHPAARLDLVRCGIAVYGLAPSPALAGTIDLRPALSLTSAVSHVKVVEAGEGISYGLRYRTSEPTVIATVPVGYADGVPRDLAAAGGHVLVDGRRRPIVGTVTMDQIMVAVDDTTGPGDRVVLLGVDGDESIGAEDWAACVDTIGYEIVCGIGPRVPRRHLPPAQER